MTIIPNKVSEHDHLKAYMFTICMSVNNLIIKLYLFIKLSTFIEDHLNIMKTNFKNLKMVTKPSSLHAIFLQIPSFEDANSPLAQKRTRQKLCLFTN